VQKPRFIGYYNNQPITKFWSTTKVTVWSRTFRFLGGAVFISQIYHVFTVAIGFASNRLTITFNLYNTRFNSTYSLSVSSHPCQVIIKKCYNICLSGLIYLIIMLIGCYLLFMQTFQVAKSSASTCQLNRL